MTSENDTLFDEENDDILASVDLEKSRKTSMFDLPEVEVKSEPSTSSKLTLYQKARAEKNRLKAMTLKQARLLSRPYQDPKSSKMRDVATGDKIGGMDKTKKVVDSGAGFFIEDDEEDALDPDKFTSLPAPIIEPDRPECLECSEDLADSFLFRTFDVSVCDKCKDTERDGKHELITKTDAKNTFLLKDYDLEKREPVLKFIVRKNPHNARWGDMKLYLRSQVEERALEVWGTEEALEKEHEKREEKKEAAKVKKFNKRIKALRMEVRGSLYKKDFSVHEHDFEEEVYNEEEDMYSKKCKTCDFVQTYEKM